MNNTKLIGLMSIVAIAAFLITATVVAPAHDAMARKRVNVARNHCHNEQHNGQNNANVGNTGLTTNINTATGNINTQNCNAANVNQRG